MDTGNKYTSVDLKAQVKASIDDAEQKGTLTKEEAEQLKAVEDSKLILTNDGYALAEELFKLNISLSKLSQIGNK